MAFAASAFSRSRRGCGSPNDVGIVPGHVGTDVLICPVERQLDGFLRPKTKKCGASLRRADGTSALREPVVTRTFVKIGIL
jgi:hypothetical protein